MTWLETKALSSTTYCFNQLGLSYFDGGIMLAIICLFWRVRSSGLYIVECFIGLWYWLHQLLSWLNNLLVLLTGFVLVLGITLNRLLMLLLPSCWLLLSRAVWLLLHLTSCQLLCRSWLYSNSQVWWFRATKFHTSANTETY